MIEIVIILIFLMFFQIVLNIIKSNKVKHVDDLKKVNELIEYLYNGQIRAIDADGKNILMIAASSHYFAKKEEKTFVDVMKLCLDRGISVNSKGSNLAKTPLYYAVVDNPYTDALEFLLSRGANVDMEILNGNTVLHYAAKIGGEKYNLVAEKSQNIDVQNVDGESPLMWALKKMNLDVVEDLLQKGADPKKVTTNGENAYDIAKSFANKNYVVIRKSETPEGTHHDMTNKQVSAARKRNHDIDEMVRRLKCCIENKPYKKKKFKKHGII